MDILYQSVDYSSKTKFSSTGGHPARSSRSRRRGEQFHDEYYKDGYSRNVPAIGNKFGLIMRLVDADFPHLIESVEIMQPKA